MLTGLIFATEDADDRPGTLAQTLPFGGMTLIEYQARLLAGVGARHLLVAVSRVTPALIGATSRMTARGMTVDVVRTAGEAAAKVHPLAQVIVVADGLVTTDAVVEWIASAGHEAVLVTRDGDGAGGGERLDAGHIWAGLARVPASRLADVAAMPADYDFQSTLLRHADQAGADHLILPAATARGRHGVERSSAALEHRSRAVLAALGDRRTAWVDRLVFTPVTGWLLPRMVARGVPGWATLAGGAVGTAAMLAFAWQGWSAAMLLAAIVTVAVLATGATLSGLRGEDAAARGQERAVPGVAAVAVLALGVIDWRAGGGATALALAAALVPAAGLAERVPVPRIRWRATPAAYPVVLLPFALAGWPATGLLAALAYAYATLGTAIETSRGEA